MPKHLLLPMAGAVVLTAGCQTVPATAGARIFQNPARFVGQTVTLCGYLIGSANILRHPSDVNVGLGIRGGVHSRALARRGERARVCLVGSISYIGCHTDPESVCTDAAFDYEIRVTEIL